MRDKDARALDCHLDAIRAEEGQRQRPNMDRDGKDAWEGCPSSLCELTARRRRRRRPTTRRRLRP
eukprot:4285166-Pyramimonas_sp.AAC.1